MRRSVGSSREDSCYWQQRECNNAVAKRSRDRRILREVRMALKVSFLENRPRRLRRCSLLAYVRNASRVISNIPQ